MCHLSDYSEKWDSIPGTLDEIHHIFNNPLALPSSSLGINSQLKGCAPGLGNRQEGPAGALVPPWKCRPGSGSVAATSGSSAATSESQ